MSEDDRAAKAARAKALLKKRQLKKGTDAPSTEISSPAISRPPSRALSPPVQQQAPNVEESQRDISSVFTQNDHEQPWPLAESVTSEVPPTPKSETPNGLALPKESDEHSLRDEIRQLREDLGNREAALEDAQKRAIKLEADIQHILSQHNSAVSQLHSQMEATRSERDQALAAEQQTATRLEQVDGICTTLRQQVQRLEESQNEKDQALQNQQQTISLLVSEKTSLAADLERLEEFEREYHDIASQLDSEKERNGLLEQQNQDLLDQNTKVENRIVELESSERESLERYRDNERQLQLANSSIAELQGQILKLRQLEEQWQNDSNDRARQLEQSLQNTQDRADALELQLSKSRQAYASAKAEKEAVAAELARLGDSNKDLLGKLQIAQQEASASAEQLAAISQSNSDVHRERDELVAKLDNARADLEESINTISSLTSQHDNVLAELKKSSKRVEELEDLQKDLRGEGADLLRSLDEMRAKVVELSGSKADLGEKISGLEHALKTRDAAILQLETSLHEMEGEKEEHSRLASESNTLLEKEKHAMQQQEQADRQLQSLVEELQAKVVSFESERANQTRELKNRAQDIDRLTTEAERYRADLDFARQTVHERTQAQEEGETLLQRIQDEVEFLRADVIAKTDTIERLRRNEVPAEGQPSLDDELLGSLRQRHTLELSASQSRIRSLETSLFEADARAHSLQKQLSAMEDRLSQMRLASNISRPSSRALGSTQEIHRPALNSQRSSSLSVYDQNLSPEARHKRHISLGLLKARLDSEVMHSKTLPPMAEEPPRHQFLDESHVFFCSSCDGDLVVL